MKLFDPFVEYHTSIDAAISAVVASSAVGCGGDSSGFPRATLGSFAVFMGIARDAFDLDLTRAGFA